MSNIEKIIDYGKVEKVSETEKNISTDVLFKKQGSIFNIKLPVRIDERGNWVIDVIKTKIKIKSTSAFPGANPGSSEVDNNIIPNSQKNLNPYILIIKPPLFYITIITQKGFKRCSGKNKRT